MRRTPLLAVIGSFLILPAAYAQTPSGPAPRPATMTPHAARPAATQHLVPRDQTLKMRSEIGDLNNRITQAETARRIPQSTAVGLRNEIKSVQRLYWSRMDHGMTPGEYGSTEAQIARLRGQFEGLLARGSHPHA